MNFTKANASHIVGAEMVYTFVGNNNYRITLNLYQDCLTGSPNAIAEDNPAYFAVYNNDNNLMYAFDSTNLQNKVTVPPNFSNDCINNPPPTCLFKATWSTQFYLPNNISGYTVVYQRCCRNVSVINIQNPSNTGATYFCKIKPSVLNNSAVFKNYPPQIICINNPLVYDHSAIDADGDSLSYEFCQSYSGGSPNDAKPSPPQLPTATLQYINPFSPTLPMGGLPPIQINPKTGLILGTPNISGRFVVTVCCNEWRNHVLINTVKREFQFVVTDCSKAVVANIPQLSSDFNTYIASCKTKTVHFINNSTGGFKYHWDFGVAGTQSDTSDLFEPTFTYPDTGVYIVKLVVNLGSTCPDSITRFVKVFPGYKSDFSYSPILCPNTPVQFTDLTISNYPPINWWTWDFGDNNTSHFQNPSHAYSNAGLYNVIMVSKSEKGCEDTVLKIIRIDDFNPFAGNDTVIVKGTTFQFNATGGTVFNWLPAADLSNPFISNPTRYFPDTGTYIYTVHITSVDGCEGDATIKIRVVGDGYLFVPSAFSPNGDGKNDIIKPFLLGYQKINYFKIFNRWGEEVYTTREIGEGWNGYYRGQLADMGTYYWMLNVKDRFGRDQFYKGDVTLLR